MSCRPCNLGEMPIGQNGTECDGMCEETVKEFTGEITGATKQSIKVPKLPVNLISPQVTECEAKVLAFGMKKYAANNWMKGLPVTEILAAIERHTLALKRGENLDPETGLPHECHIRCETMFLNWQLHGPRAFEYNKFDDRVFSQVEGVPRG